MIGTINTKLPRNCWTT